MARNELKNLLPYEEFLRRALRDSDSDGTSENDNSRDQSLLKMPKPRLSIPKIRINDMSPSNAKAK